MKLIDSRDLENYLHHDWVLDILRKEAQPGDESLILQRWLVDAPAKRVAFSDLYSDLFAPSGRKILDVGGGITAATRALARAHDYCVVDILAHGGKQVADALAAELGRDIVVESDWLSYANATSGRYDVVIANDIFPNVDQRLDLFLNTFLPRAREVRLTLTFYNKPHYYLCRRIDGEEVFCVLAWDGERTGSVMARHKDAIVDPDLSIFASPAPSLYENGRLVCVATLKGAGGDPH